MHHEWIFYVLTPLPKVLPSHLEKLANPKQIDFNDSSVVEIQILN